MFLIFVNRKVKGQNFLDLLVVRLMRKARRQIHAEKYGEDLRGYRKNTRYAFPATQKYTNMP